MNDLISKALRHGFAALGGWLLQQGIYADANSTASILAALVCFVIAVTWSVLVKRPLEADRMKTMQLFALAIMQQLVAALAGWLQASGHQVDAADPAALTLFSANLAISKITRPDKGVPIPAAGLKLIPLLLCAAALSACVGPGMSERQLYTRQAGLVAAQIGLSVAESALAQKMSDPNTPAWQILAAQLTASQARSALVREQAKLDAAFAALLSGRVPAELAMPAYTSAKQAAAVLP